ncbi:MULTISPECIES: LysR substrate-binding domain-containing protein [Cupriavidus]|uniref:LysR substrate-binding domain-containing protein n=1 Tax=Cupriavidus TaxID=106589 RepID=UPI001F25942B|nr:MULTISPECIES: LysR substrate-binding domain-containing protein [Cupriavidus]
MAWLPTAGTLIAKRLADNRRALCASPRYIQQFGVPVHPVGAQVPTAVVGLVANEWHFAHDGETVQSFAPVASSRETNDGALAREWAVEGGGISDLRDGRLELLLPEWRCPDLPLNALFQRNRYMAPRVRVLLHFLGERIALAFAELERFFR